MVQKQKKCGRGRRLQAAMTRFGRLTGRDARNRHIRRQMERIQRLSEDLERQKGV